MPGGRCIKYIEISKNEKEKYDDLDGKGDFAKGKGDFRLLNQYTKRERTITIIERQCPCNEYSGYNEQLCRKCNHEYGEHTF